MIRQQEKSNLLETKKRMREEIITRIKLGNFTNNLSQLLDIVGDLSLEERKLIGRSWFQNNQKRLISCYLYDLLTDNRESIKRTDIHFLNANLSNLKR